MKKTLITTPILLFLCLFTSNIYSNIPTTHMRAKTLERLPKNTIGAEIGVFKGAFSKDLLQYIRPKKLYLIDPWYVGPKKVKRMYGINNMTQKTMDSLHQNVQNLFKNRSDVEIIRKKSSNAALLFSDEYFDWVYVDGDHTFQGALDDLVNYYPKLKPGGIFIIDDYKYDSVREAIYAFLKLHPELKHEIIYDKKVQFFIQKPKLG